MNLPAFNILSGLRMKRSAFLVGAVCAALGLAAPLAMAQANKPIRIGVPTAMQLQVGRDTQDAIKMAIDDINAKGGVLGRKLEMVVADETENPETGISAIKKLTADEKVDVLIGGYTSGVTLAQLPHISAAKTIYLGVGARLALDPGQGQDRLRQLQIRLPRRAAARRPPGAPAHRLHLDLRQGRTRHQQDRHRRRERQVGAGPGAAAARRAPPTPAPTCARPNSSTAQTSDFSPLFSKVKESGAQYLIVCCRMRPATSSPSSGSTRASRCPTAASTSRAWTATSASASAASRSAKWRPTSRCARR